jgi:hypothetical protein
MRSSDATDSHMPMILNLISWMEHVGLVSVRDDFIVAHRDDGVAASPEQPADQERSADPAAADSPAADETPARAQELPPPTLIALGLDIRLTVDDLARLSPEQIKAIFEAVGTLAAASKPGE